MCDFFSVFMCIFDNSLFVFENNWFILEIWLLDCLGGNIKIWKKMCLVDLIKRGFFFRECVFLLIVILDKIKLLFGGYECIY